MHLRKLKLLDAPLMLEWMHEEEITKWLKADFGTMTLDDCLHFIQASLNCNNNLHLAITNSQDIYMGTVSLKNIDKEKKHAEFAIVLRSCALGHGFSKYAMQEILRIGFERLNLKYIYWYVSKNNVRAIRFYEKNRYRPTKLSDSIIPKINLETNNLEYNWYIVNDKAIKD